MVMWTFWTIFILSAYAMLSLTFLFINMPAIKFYFELWRGRKFLAIWKRGNVVIEHKLLKSQGVYGLKRGEETFAVDDKKALRLKRLPIHLFDVDNVAEVDFTEKANIYPPHKLDPVVYQKAIRRALASGVNDEDNKWMILAIIGGAIVILASLAGAYFGYQNYELIRDYLVNQAIIKI